MACDSDSDSDSSDSDIEPPFFFLHSQLEDKDPLWTILGERRRPKQRYDRMDFEKHVRLQSNADMLQRCCHMTPQSFLKLVSLLAPHLEVNEQRQPTAGARHPLHMSSQWGSDVLVE